MQLNDFFSKHLPFKTAVKSAYLGFKTRPQRKRMHFAKEKSVRVSYGQSHVPTFNEVAFGGMVKFQWMQTLYPNNPELFNILYMVSSQPPEGAEHIANTAKKIGAHFAWNQNGVAYPGWYGWRWKERNQRMAKTLHMADHVFYQSEFCQMAADEFLGPCKSESEILYNPVNTEIFTPATPSPNELILLLAGNQYQHYRLKNALETLALVKKQYPEAKILITGKLNWLPDQQETRRMAQEWIDQLGIANSVTFYGPYNQSEAPKIFQSAHILLHTRYNDPCPTVVLEALASGLPVVYSNSGGTPELVGPDAGIGIDTQLNWEKEQPPSPDALADAVLKIVANRNAYVQAARARAVTKFDIKPWLQRHQDVFESLLAH